MRIFRLGAILFIFILIGQLAPADFALASSTDGTIDSAYKYVWGENIGWLNFGCDNCSVGITDSGLSGYAFGENTGWLYLGDVSNDGEGNLSGYAWGENIGWINFAPTNGGVVINSSGEFTGSALGENIGWIIFGGDYKVKTDWRPQSARQAPSGGGSGLPPAAYNLPTLPSGGFSVSILDNAEYTSSRTVTLTLNGGPDAKKMAISEHADFYGAGQEPYQTTKTWTLTENEGVKTIYVKFCTQWGHCSELVSDSIILIKGTTIVEKIKEVSEKIVEEIKKIPEIFKPRPPEVKPPEVPIEELVSKETPLVFQGKWQLLPREPIRKFVLAPLPKEIEKLVQKFPQLKKTFEEVGIAKITDVAKLKNVKLTLPGLKEIEEMPAEIVFAKTGGKLIDFNIVLSINEKGELQQKISTISGKPLQLVVKPGKPVKSIKGYVVFKAKGSPPTSLELPFNSFLASVIFANPVFAKTQEKPVRVEEKLVLLEFEYTDPDGDGIYTAEIQVPVVEGEYEIITVLEFEDPELGTRVIRLITVVDPEGYIYRKIGNEQARISQAIVSLLWLNPKINKYELWPAKEYQQENPQTTDVRGTYSFLVPEGSYYIKVETPSYLVYEGNSFQVKEGSGIHINIELKTKYQWLKVVDWKTTLLIVVIMLLIYNFYRGKIREKLSKKL